LLLRVEVALPSTGQNLMITKTLQVTAWLLALAIAVLSLIPPSLRPITNVPHPLEHLAIFLATGLAFGFGYPSRHLSQIIALVTLAGAIEIAQLWVPERHSRLGDFVVNALGLCIGVGLAYLIRRRAIGTAANPGAEG
jgi:VanZ family protein